MGEKESLDPKQRSQGHREGGGTHLSISETQRDLIHSCSCTGISLRSENT